MEGVIGLGQSGHFPQEDDLCHCCWFAEDAEQLAAGASLRENALALLLQSNLGLSTEQETSIARRAGAGYRLASREVPGHA